MGKARMLPPWPSYTAKKDVELSKSGRAVCCNEIKQVINTLSSKLKYTSDSQGNLNKFFLLINIRS